MCLPRGGFVLRDTRQCTSTVSCTKWSHGPALTCIFARLARCLFGDKEMSLYSNNLSYVLHKSLQETVQFHRHVILCFPPLYLLCKKRGDRILQDYLLKLVHFIHPLSILLSNHSTRFIFLRIRYKIGLWWKRC